MEGLLGLQDKDLIWYQMVLRSIIVFFIALLFIRLSGMRSFKSASAFDVVVSITLGGLLSRCIAGHYPFFTTLLATFTIIACHQLTAYLSYYLKWFRYGTEGKAVCLYNNGRKRIREMMRHAVNEEDLNRALHEANVDDYSKIKSIWYEVDGKISVIKND